MNTLRTLLSLLILLLPLSAHAAGEARSLTAEELVSGLASDTLLQQVAEQREFHGLALYLNHLRFYRVTKTAAEPLAPEEEITLGAGEWFAVAGRFKVLAIQGEGTTLRVTEKGFSLASAEHITAAHLVDKNALAALSPELDHLRYAHLWVPLAALSKGMEWSIATIQSLFSVGWGMAIVLFSIALKIAMLPVGLFTVHAQRRVSRFHTLLAPQLAEIKRQYDGEEAHNRLMAAHKELGITPFYSLRPMLGMFIQVPILVAVFNALAEMPQFAGQSFLWIDDLAYPDAVLTLPFTLPMFGNLLSLLPFLMTVVTLLSTIIFRNRHALPAEVKRQKRNLYLMALAFFILFYPFPAAMVLFWAMANILQTIQQQVIRL